MTKKDFIALADALRKVGVESYTDTATFVQCVRLVADALAADNPRFDRDRWYRYVCGECGPNGGKRT